MDEFPALAEMGITRFREISHYALTQEGEKKDALRIYYKRAKGSLLPVSRKYKFGRSTKTVRAASGIGGTQEVHEISPFLQKALIELDSLVTQHKTTIDEKQLMLADIEELEHSVLSTCSSLRARIKRL
ncbi:MAG: hypothetical protein ACI9DC_002317 [Gammaproteobacteria bacterium]|jgi:hypothetical protein